MEIQQERAEAASPVAILGRPRLLPELFSILQQVENGELKPQDFEKNSGSIRLALDSIRKALMETDGICETIEEREQRIALLEACSKNKAAFLADFKTKVSADLGKDNL